MRRYPAGGVGDMTKVSVEGVHQTPVVRCSTVIRQRRRSVVQMVRGYNSETTLVSSPISRVKSKGRISRTCFREAAERWPRIAATAKQIV